MYILDTHFCIHLISKRPPKALDRLIACPPDQVGLSAITLSELAYGVSGSPTRERNREALELFLVALPVLEYPAEAAFAYGEIRAVLEQKGVILGAMDLMIAAHAVAVGATLVSNKPKEFRRVPGLQVENWAR